MSESEKPGYEEALRDVVAFLHSRALAVLDDKGNPEVFRALVKAAKAIENGEVRR